MDPVSVVGLLASIEGLVGGAFKVVSCLKTIKDGGKERSRLLVELIGLRTVLLTVSEHFDSDVKEDHDPWLKTIATLDEDDGIFDQISHLFDKLESRLRPKTGHRKMLQALRWPFDKSEVEALVDQLERCKNSINIAITSTNAAALRTVLSDNRRILDDTQIIKEWIVDEELGSIIDWISSLNFLDKQTEIVKQTREGTGQWFIQRDEFRSWSSSRAATLWGFGIPGSGKTSIAAIVFEHLKKINRGQNVAVLIAYCDYSDTGT